MTEYELELIRMIRNEEHPEQALMVAATIIIDFLKQHESSEVPSADSLQALS